MDTSKKVVGLVFSIILLGAPSLNLAEVFISAEEATKKIFPTLQEYNVKICTLDKQEFKIFEALKESKILGWAVVVNEMGKIKPITFLVGIDTKGEVLDVYLLEYRDMFGSEIKRRSFLRQFKGKSLKAPIRIGKDIDVVTGATISSHAATSAVRKSLKLIEEIRKNNSGQK